MQKKPRSQKSLLTLVEERAAKAPQSGKNRAALMPMRDEIAEVLARGYKWCVVWETLRDAERISMGYDTFRIHCRAMGLEAAPKSYSKWGKPEAKKSSRRK